MSLTSGLQYVLYHRMIIVRSTIIDELHWHACEHIGGIQLWELEIVGTVVDTPLQ